MSSNGPGTDTAAPVGPLQAPRWRRSSLLKVVLTLVVLLVLLLVLLPVGLYAALRSESGTGWLLPRLPGVTVERPRGALLGDFTADRLDLLLGSAGHLSLEQPVWAGLSLRLLPETGSVLALRLERLGARRARLTLAPAAPDAAPSSGPPTALRLPASVQIDALTLGEFSTAALGDQPLRDLAASVSLGGEAGTTHRIDLQRLDWDRLRATGRLQIGADAPLPLQVALQVQPLAAIAAGGSASAPTGSPTAWDPMSHWLADARLSGPLARPRLQARVSPVPPPGAASAPSPTAGTSSTASANTARAATAPRRGAGSAPPAAPLLEANAVLLPFAAWPLAELQAQARGLDLAAFSSAAPATALSGAATVRSTGMDQLARVDLSLDNAQAGPWNARQLPLRTLRLALQARPDQPEVISVQRFEADLGSLRQPAGRLSGEGQYDRGRWHLATVLDGLLPQGLDARAAPMRLSGELRLEGESLEPGAPAASASGASRGTGGTGRIGSTGSTGSAGGTGGTGGQAPRTSPTPAPAPGTAASAPGRDTLITAKARLTGRLDPRALVGAQAPSASSSRTAAATASTRRTTSASGASGTTGAAASGTARPGTARSGTADATRAAVAPQRSAGTGTGTGTGSNSTSASATASRAAPARSSPPTQQAEVQLLADAQVRLGADGSLRLDARQLEARAGGASARLNGRVERRDEAAPWQVDLRGDLRDFDPRPWWVGATDNAWRRGPHRLNADFRADLNVAAEPAATSSAPSGRSASATPPGRPAPATPRAEQAAPGSPTAAPADPTGALLTALGPVRGLVELVLRPSVLAGVPLDGNARLQSRGRAGGPAEAELTLALQAAGNKLSARATSRADRPADDRAQLEIDAPTLSTLSPVAALFGLAPPAAASPGPRRVTANTATAAPAAPDATTRRVAGAGAGAGAGAVGGAGTTGRPAAGEGRGSTVAGTGSAMPRSSTRVTSTTRSDLSTRSTTISAARPGTGTADVDAAIRSTTPRGRGPATTTTTTATTAGTSGTSGTSVNSGTSGAGGAGNAAGGALGAANTSRVGATAGAPPPPAARGATPAVAAARFANDALSGRLVARATVQGRWPSVRTDGQLEAERLRVGDLALQRGELRWLLGTRADAPADVQATLSRLAVGDTVADNVALKVTGTARAHQIALDADSAALPGRRAASATTATPASAAGTGAGASPATRPAATAASGGSGSGSGSGGSGSGSGSGQASGTSVGVPTGPAAPASAAAATPTTGAAAGSLSPSRPIATAGTSPTRATLRAEGGLVFAPRSADPLAAVGWRGRIQELMAQTGSTPANLVGARSKDLVIDTAWAADAPARASLQPGRIELQAGPTTAALRWSRLQWQAGLPATAARAAQVAQIEVDAVLEPIAVAPLLARAQPDFGWGGDLVMAGTLTLRSAPALRADIVIERRSGDLGVTDEFGTQRLGLTDLRVGLSANDGVWSFTQALAGSAVGVAAGAVVARTGSPTAWPDAGTPIEGVLELRVANLGTWGPWVPTGWRLGGELHTSASIGGRIGAPEYTGALRGSNLTVRNFAEGVNVADGQVQIALQGETARIERFTARAGKGTVTLTGGASFGASPQASLSLVAERFQLLGRVDRRIVASGQGQLRLDANAIALNGKFAVDEGLVDFTRGDAPSLSEDVVVIRPPKGTVVAQAQQEAEQKAGAAASRIGAESTMARNATDTPAKPPPPAARAVALDLRVDLGRELRLRGRGLDTGLRGELHITSPNGRMAVNGTVSTEGGTYQAYGQKLTVDRGAVIFTGVIENPRLDIEATRPNTDVRVGVIVSGTAGNPRIRLFSEPELAEVDKLSWLVLGRATDGLGRTDTALLQRAALALLSGEGPGMTDRLSRAIGLDEVSLRQSDGEVKETVVSLGKQLSKRWYVGYERSLNATAGSWQLIYRIAQRLTLRAQTGFENAMDLNYTWRWQ